MPNLLLIFLTFLKIGAVSFGGGYGMISIVREEVLKNEWLTEEGFTNFIAVAESTPGPIAINMATYIGSTQEGILGSLVATIGVVLPAFIIMLLFVICLKKFFDRPVVKEILGGIKPVVAALIISTAIIMFITRFIGITTYEDTFIFEWKNIIIFIILFGISFLYKHFKKKKFSPILLIVISGILGIIFYKLI